MKHPLKSKNKLFRRLYIILVLFIFTVVFIVESIWKMGSVALYAMPLNKALFDLEESVDSMIYLCSFWNNRL